MVDYASLATLAEKLIGANGRNVTLTLKSRTAADSAKPWRGPDTADTNVAVQAVIVPFEEEEIDGQLVRRGDKRAFVAALDTGAQAVETFDQITDGTDTWKIVSVSVINPGDTLVMYDIQLRR